MGQCNSCGEWNTLEESQISAVEKRAAKMVLVDAAVSTKLSSGGVDFRQRVSTPFNELNDVLGGGFVEDQVILLAGEPGIGKSTLLLQLAVDLKAKNKSVVYVSGEESVSQVGRRANRLFSGEVERYEDIDFMGSLGVGSLIASFDAQKPEFVIIDSIQTMFDETLSSLPGSLAQVKSCTSKLVSAAKSIGFVLVLVGHINKDGGIAGPKVLEHLVDTVLNFEGEREADYRLVRVAKNRFGSTGEVGLLIMTEAGLIDLNSEYNIFDSGENSPGVARTLVVEGNRPLVLEVQALVTSTVFPYPKRVAEGMPISRLQLICAILDKYAKLNLGDKDVYVRTTGGYSLKGTESDLAIAAAIISSMKSKAYSPNEVFVGELSLGGSVSVSGRIASKFGALGKFGMSGVFAPWRKPVKGIDIKPMFKVSAIKSLLK
jgi:DNA repair protein RadA/Sms